MTDGGNKASQEAAAGPLPTAVARAGVVGVVLVYALFAALWILLSDMVLEWWLDSPSQLALASTLKGWAFVLITSLLLYGLLRGFELRGGAATGAQAELAHRPRIRLQIAGLALAITALTAGVVLHDVRKGRQDLENDLQNMADLKSQQVANWIADRLAHVQQLHDGEHMARLYQRWRGQADTEALAILAERISQVVAHGRFGHGVLLDEAGEILWQSTPEIHAVDPETRQRLLQAARARGSGWLGPYRDAHGHIHLDFYARLKAAPEGGGPIVVLHGDEPGFLPAAADVWPLASSTGEVLLFRREADRIVYISALRHDPDAALLLRSSRTGELPLMQLLDQANGATGLLEGRDYRGVDVIGVGRPVPGTDWYLVAKLDRDELYTRAIGNSLWVVLAGVLALFAAATTLYLMRQNRQLAVARAVEQGQAEHLRALRLLAAIADNSADCVFAKDLEGRYIVFNRAASVFSGKDTAQVLGQDDGVVFPADQAAMIRANDRRVMEEGRVVSCEETLDTPLGLRTVLAVKGPLYGEDGRVVGMYGISRDITQRAAAEDELRRSNEELLRFNQVMVGRELEMIRLKGEINALAQALGRPAPYDLRILEAEPAAGRNCEQDQA